ncbi:MAG: mechanosensitive ion channel domain-containing protein [bacterium]
MEVLYPLLSKVTDLVPTGVALIIVVFVVWAVKFTLNKRYAGVSGHQFRLQLVILILSFVGLLAVILTLPLSETMIGQLIGLLGILLSAVIALSAMTFVGNIMAGLMLRAVKNFRPGDFVRVGDHFGRVSERGLFHIEIQTEDRDLTTLPNQYLVTNPVKVIRSSGTLVRADVSLGYDVSRVVVERVLLEAATDAELEEPFVYVMELGDFSVTYRIAGLLTEVRSLLSTRSRLHEMMLDRLHAAGIEIVSPNFMYQRVLDKDVRFIAKPAPKKAAVEPMKPPPEAVVFDKADEAESLEKLREQQEELHKELNELKSALAKAPDDTSRNSIEDKIEWTKVRLERLTNNIAKREQEGK